MTIAIIPARGGSKRIPRKNIKLFAGKPILQYAISVAKESRLFEEIVVSSEDEEILSFAKDCNVHTIMRPSVLAEDKTPTVPVISDAIKICENWNWHFNEVCCIYPTVPFLSPELLVKTFALFKKNSAEYVFPIAAFQSPIQRALRLKDDGMTLPFAVQNEIQCSQDLIPAYYDAGQFYWGKKSAWLEEKSIHSHGYGYIIPHWNAIDINTPDDWVKAELFYDVLIKRESK